MLQEFDSTQEIRRFFGPMRKNRAGANDPKATGSLSNHSDLRILNVKYVNSFAAKNADQVERKTRLLDAITGSKTESPGAFFGQAFQEPAIARRLARQARHDSLIWVGGCPGALAEDYVLSARREGTPQVVGPGLDPAGDVAEAG